MDALDTLARMGFSPAMERMAWAFELMLLLQISISHKVWKTSLLPGLVFCLVYCALNARLEGLRPSLALLVVGVCTTLAAECFIRVTTRRRWMAQSRSAIVVGKPVLGEWSVTAAGPSRSRNHHIFAKDQRFAVDLDRLDAPSWGSPIVSPVNGTVTAVRESIRDTPERNGVAPSAARKDPFGNYVVIGFGEGHFAVLCHLRTDSIMVAVGDVVSVGQVMAACGNSGRSTGPHLHMHVQDTTTPAIDRARGIPFTFDDRPYITFGQTVVT